MFTFAAVLPASMPALAVASKVAFSKPFLRCLGGLLEDLLHQLFSRPFALLHNKFLEDLRSVFPLAAVRITSAASWGWQAGMVTPSCPIADVASFTWLPPRAPLQLPCFLSVWQALIRYSGRPPCRFPCRHTLHALLRNNCSLLRRAFEPLLGNIFCCRLSNLSCYLSSSLLCSLFQCFFCAPSMLLAWPALYQSACHTPHLSFSLFCLPTALRPRIRKLEEAVAVQNSLLEKFSDKFRRCWKIIHRFSGSTKCYPCQGLGIFRQGKWLLEN